jgi:hypothetical protein
MNNTICFVAISIALLTGCGPKLTAEGARARIATAEAVNACRPVSNVDGKGKSKDEAEIALRNKAGEMNADSIVLADTSEGTDEVMMSGKAYSCSSAQNSGAPTP